MNRGISFRSLTISLPDQFALTCLYDKKVTSIEYKNQVLSNEGDTPLWYAVFMGFRRYAVRKWSVRSTKKSCYIVRRHQFLLNKMSNFHHETQQT